MDDGNDGQEVWGMVWAEIEIMDKIGSEDSIGEGRGKEGARLFRHGPDQITHLLDGVARAFCGMEAATGFFPSLIPSLCRYGVLGYHYNLVGGQAGTKIEESQEVRHPSSTNPSPVPVCITFATNIHNRHIHRRRPSPSPTPCLPPSH